MKLATKNFLKIRTFGITLSLFMASSLFSCSDSDDPGFLPKLPANEGDNVTSIRREGSIATTCYDWSFYYKNNRLTNAAGIIRDPDENIDSKHRYSSDIGYGRNFVEVYNSNTDRIDIQLNSYNYIEKMTVGKNIYEFQYSDGRLKSWQKTIFEDTFGHGPRYKSAANLTYNNGDLEKIEFTGPDNVVVTTTFTNYLDKDNSNGLLPEAVANEMGCLGFEHLYYAGLLGRPTNHLVKSLTSYHPKDKNKCYTLQFEYSRKGENINLCNYNTPSGDPVSVIYKYNK